MQTELSNREYWNEKLTTYLSDYFWDNCTDFNYSTCYTYFVASDENRFALGSRGLNEFLTSGNVAYYVKVQISCKAPLLCVDFCKYDRTLTAFSTSGIPYTQAQGKIYSMLELFADNNNLQIVRYSDMPETIYQEYFETDA